jgi:hypothetical protein
MNIQGAQFHISNGTITSDGGVVSSSVTSASVVATSNSGAMDPGIYSSGPLGIVARTENPAGTAAVFEAFNGAKLLSLQKDGATEVLGVDYNGKLTVDGTAIVNSNGQFGLLAGADNNPPDPNAVGIQASGYTALRAFSQTCTSGPCTLLPGTAGQFIVGDGGTAGVFSTGNNGTILVGTNNNVGQVFRIDSNGSGFFSGNLATSGSLIVGGNTVINSSGQWVGSPFATLGTQASPQNNNFYGYESFTGDGAQQVINVTQPGNVPAVNVAVSGTGDAIRAISSGLQTIYGENDAAEGGTALVGVANGNGPSTGVSGQATSPRGAGMQGNNTSPIGNGGAGVTGFANASSGLVWGVLGNVDSNPPNPDAVGIQAGGYNAFRAFSQTCAGGSCQLLPGTAGAFFVGDGGTAGAFSVGNSGTILLGNSNSGQVFRVDSTGAVFANSYRDLSGNPVLATLGSQSSPQSNTFYGTQTVNGTETLNGNSNAQVLNVTQSGQGNAITVSNAAVDTNGDGVTGATILAHNSATTGVARAIVGISDADTGRAVLGWSTSSTGATIGVYGRSDSNSFGATGVRGYATASSGQTDGVQGFSASSDSFAAGVYGENVAATGLTVGVLGQSDSNTTGAAGLVGAALASNGITHGIRGIVDSGQGIAGAFMARSTGTVLDGFSYTGPITTANPPLTEVFRVDGTGNVFAGAYNYLSDRNAKEHLHPVEGALVLAKLAKLPMFTWSYRSDPAVQHIGPMAQDFHAAFGFGGDEKHIGIVDSEGVALAAIQQLYRINVEKDQRIEAISRELEQLRATRNEVAVLRAQLAELAGKMEMAHQPTARNVSTRRSASKGRKALRKSRHSAGLIPQVAQVTVSSLGSGN